VAKAIRQSKANDREREEPQKIAMTTKEAKAIPKPKTDEGDTNDDGGRTTRTDPKEEEKVAKAIRLGGASESNSARMQEESKN
jgi:hypothetical protein